MIARQADIRLVRIALKRSRIGIECKRMGAPVLTASMRIALTDLKLDEIRIAYPGDKRYALAKNVEVVPLAQLVDAM